MGDVVRIARTPMRASKRKAYRVASVLRRARAYSPSLGEAALEEHQARRAAEAAAAGGDGTATGGDGTAAGALQQQQQAPPRVARAEAALEAARRRLAELREAHAREASKVAAQAGGGASSSFRT